MSSTTIPQAQRNSCVTDMARLPMIRLDSTLAELYRRASPRNANKRIAQILCGTNSGIALSANFPRNSKYVYQDSPFNTAEAERDTSANAQRTLAMKYLSLIPQRDAFISGKTPVVFFNLGDTSEQVEQDRREAERTISVLAEDQKPELIFCPGPDQIPVEEAGIDLIASKLVLDGLDKYNLIVSPETQWYLNSKAALAQSGLPTPLCEALKLDGHGDEAELCCTACRKSTDEFVIPELCTGTRRKWLEKESEKIYKAVKERKLPFVLKNQQTFGGAGTYIINTESERRGLIEELRGGVLKKLLSSVVSSNSHLKPGTILLSDLVAEPIGDYGVTFFVADDGSDPIFLATSEQMTQGPAWIGSTINYDHQDELRAKFGPLVKAVAKWLEGHGYVGPAGADVLETAPQSRGGNCTVEDTNGRTRATSDTPSQSESNNPSTTPTRDFPHFHIVDLNVRTSGSLCLPLLRGHFTSRGMNSASSFSMSVRKTRDEFIEMFRNDFKTGRICIISWYEDKESGVSLADVVVGARNEWELKGAIDRVRGRTDGVTF